jgi:hypothetical protein
MHPEVLIGTNSRASSAGSTYEDAQSVGAFVAQGIPVPAAPSA